MITGSGVRDEWAKSQRALAAAKRNAGDRDFETAANRLYFAALHAAKAVLLTEQIEPKRHRAGGRPLHLFLTVTAPWPQGGLQHVPTRGEHAHAVIARGARLHERASKLT